MTPSLLKPQEFFPDVPPSPLPRAPEVFSCLQHLLRPKKHEPSPGTLLPEKQPWRAVLTKRSKCTRGDLRQRGRPVGAFLASLRHSAQAVCLFLSEGKAAGRTPPASQDTVNSQEAWSSLRASPGFPLPVPEPPRASGSDATQLSIYGRVREAMGRGLGLGFRSAPPACAVPISVTCGPYTHCELLSEGTAPRMAKSVPSGLRPVAEMRTSARWVMQ